MKQLVKIYNQDKERAEILVEAVKEYFDKIITNNALDFEHLVFYVEKEIGLNYHGQTTSQIFAEANAPYLSHKLKVICSLYFCI